MLKRMLKIVGVLLILVVVVCGCSEFFGTINGRIAANKHAMEYISKKYNVPIEQLAAELPSYRYGQRLYVTGIHDKQEHKKYTVYVRMWGEGEVMDIYEE
ncbi:hypothetical protein [Brevibacillus gelatini]|uniref:hypothetical protein n=1 Tax=Brevibacillus gelatini TaxID=1655277 RepID=UPI003D814862